MHRYIMESNIEFGKSPGIGEPDNIICKVSSGVSEVDHKMVKDSHH